MPKGLDLGKGDGIIREALSATLVLAFTTVLAAALFGLCACSAKADSANVFDEISNDGFECFRESENASYVGGFFPSPDDFGVELSSCDGVWDSLTMRVERKEDESILRFYATESFRSASNDGSSASISYLATYSTRYKRLVLIKPDIVVESSDGRFGLYAGVEEDSRGYWRVDYDQAAEVLAEFGVSADDVEKMRRLFVGAFVSAYLDEAGRRSAYSEDDWGDYETILA